MNFTLPRLFRNPAISNFFPFPLGLRNSGVRLYVKFLQTLLLQPRPQGVFPSQSRGKAPWGRGWLLLVPSMQHSFHQFNRLF